MYIVYSIVGGFLIRYKTQFPESYIDGTVSFSVTIGKETFLLLNEKQISNKSAFINDLLIGALRTSAYWTKKALADFEAAKEELAKEGFLVAATINKMTEVKQ